MNERAETYAREKDAAVSEVLALLTQHRQGRLFIGWLFDITKRDQVTFTGHALSGSFSQGEQNVGLQILDRLLDSAPDGYIKFETERLNDARSLTNSNPGTEPDAGDADT